MTVYLEITGPEIQWVGLKWMNNDILSNGMAMPGNNTYV